MKECIKEVEIQEQYDGMEMFQEIKIDCEFYEKGMCKVDSNYVDSTTGLRVCHKDKDAVLEEEYEERLRIDALILDKAQNSIIF